MEHSRIFPNTPQPFAQPQQNIAEIRQSVGRSRDRLRGGWTGTGKVFREIEWLTASEIRAWIHAKIIKPHHFPSLELSRHSSFPHNRIAPMMKTIPIAALKDKLS